MTLEQLSALLEPLGNGSSEVSRQAALELSTLIGRPANVRRLLESIEGSPEQLQRIAQSSFRHTNHFEKIVLLDEEGDSRFRLSLHLWRPPYTSEEVVDEHIHDHRSDFWSTVLFGEIESWEFVRTEQGGPYYETLYRPARSRRGGKVNEYSPNGVARLRSSGTKRWSAGSTYYLHRETIHRIAISQTAAATLLLKAPHVSPATSLFSTSPWSSRRVELKPFHVSWLVDCFEFIRRNLPW